MTIQKAHRSRAGAARVPGAMVIAVFAAVAATPGRSSAESPLVESTAAGEIEIEARGVPIADLLYAIAAESGFEVAIADGGTRRSVHATLSPAPVEDILREILHERNYALVFDGDTGSLNQVILLEPSGPRSSRPAPPAKRSRRTRQTRNKARGAAGPVVVQR